MRTMALCFGAVLWLAVRPTAQEPPWNTGQMDVGEGMLWRSKVEPTSFVIHVADPVAGQVAYQARVKVQGRDTLIAVRLRIDHGRIAEIERLWAGGIAPEAIALLTTPTPLVTEDVPPAHRVSRDVMFRVANSYFDALEGEVTMETFSMRGG